ncbi:HD domain-containing protein [Chamaesiphon polymorphus]|uniref:Bifunctional (P)ppGpp synthetase/guanosine-3',5'-bis(Diphosphate) 3'-pyrophosphohydrolase n=1 Tax=Chamaesiphon polymorphus CCALA 037 TaxID=2107692 RepID=A0A2T1GLK6_9CYAN|nr:HD domain-containing protein [Chamaesiphon polymorphus]PSB58682.1 bifunctional (p)ppGpp synthetase/guanosine-3',5'-bis(diphosphate) 3'-pyrophosphohydrolase [Chamaesiphon polymorphus CCALA 037]
MTSSWNRELYIKACQFAAQAHLGQLVPGSDLPYLLHLNLVSMEILAALGAEAGHDGDLAVQCALLHDTIEDTDTTYDRIATIFGVRVADGVAALSKNPELEKSQQLLDSLHRIERQPREIWMVKLADRITNLQPPPIHWDSAKIRRYREEAIEIYTHLQSASPFLAKRLAAKIQNYPPKT